MDPNKVKPNNFKVEKIIYTANSFSIAKGIWKEDSSSRYAMRWDGNSDKELGYPSIFGNPMWFQLPKDFKTIIDVLINDSNSTK